MSISNRCHLFEAAFVWELTKEIIHLPLGCLQGGKSRLSIWASKRQIQVIKFRVSKPLRTELN